MLCRASTRDRAVAWNAAVAFLALGFPCCGPGDSALIAAVAGYGGTAEEPGDDGGKDHDSDGEGTKPEVEGGCSAIEWVQVPGDSFLMGATG